MTDFFKTNKVELENRLSDGSLGARKLKKQAFELRMDRLSDSQKNAKSEHESNRFNKIRTQTLEKYNKYNNSIFKD